MDQSLSESDIRDCFYAHGEIGAFLAPNHRLSLQFSSTNSAFPSHENTAFPCCPLHKHRLCLLQKRRPFPVSAASVRIVPKATCAFVTYTSRSGAEMAAERLHNRLIIKGKRLRLQVRP